LTAIAATVVLWAAIYSIRYLIQLYFLRRIVKAKWMDRDEIIASLRLRLPPGADLVALEHQTFYMDERNRAAAANVLIENGFTISAAETYENATRFWLLATRSTLVERAPEEWKLVVDLTRRYGGRYDHCNPQL
jgi:hypothetical protein